MTVEARQHDVDHPSAPPAMAGGGGRGHGHPGGSTVGSVRPTGLVYARAPMLIYWESTLACGLACRHCRATATTERGPAELSTEEAVAMFEAITGFGQPLPHMVITGGDPLLRDDLEELVSEASRLGIGCSLAPAVTPQMDPHRLKSLAQSGIQTMSLSLDGSTAPLHDGLRGVPGTFDTTMQAFSWAAEAGLPVQVNTLVTDQTLADLPAIYDLLLSKPVMRWSLFFLISVGRGTQLREITPGQAERLFHWLHERAADAPFQIKTTEAMHYRRVAIRRMEAAGRTRSQIRGSAVGRGFGVRDGNGIVFVDHEGQVHPSGFLPVPVGNVRTSSIVELYREHPVFTSLRDTSQFKGRCGTCAYAGVCGGSRARAHAWTGDFLASDPLCPFQPPAGSTAWPEAGDAS